MRGYEDLKVIKVKAASGAGTTEVNSDTVDLADYEGVLFVVTANAITSGGAQSAKVEHGDESSLSDKADVSGLSITIADDDDNESFVLDYRKTTKRYCCLTLLRATQNSAFGEIYAICYGGHTKAINNTVASTVTVDHN